MSKELLSKGLIVGSQEYFQNINQNEISEITDKAERSDYHGIITSLAVKSVCVIEEIHKDITKLPRILNFVEKSDRDNLLNLVLTLDELSKYGGKSCLKTNDCKSYLTLSNSKTKLKSKASKGEIEKAVKILKNGGKISISKSERISVAQKALAGGVKQAVGGNIKKADYLKELMQGYGTEFLDDVFIAYSYAEKSSNFSSFNKHFTSKEYIENAEKKVFHKPYKISILRSRKTYTASVKLYLNNIARAISGDLDSGIKNNDYIKDDSADALKEVIAQLEKCAIKCNGIKDKIDKLAWFVGGNPVLISEMQRKLNALGIQGASGNLLEDGVYGKETLAAWGRFLDKLAHGAVPSLTWTNPLQSSRTGIEFLNMTSKTEIVSSLRDYSSRSSNPKGTTIFRSDTPHGGHDYYHINTVEGKTLKKGQYTPSDLQRKYINKYNHYEISDSAYATLQRFDNTAKKVNVAGKVLLVAGIVLDALELGLAIDTDLKDADKKIGKKTVSTAAQIVGRWAGGLAGSKFGAMAGAVIGTAILPGPGTAIGGFVGGLVLGITGSFTGDKLAEWVVDISCAELGVI